LHAQWIIVDDADTGRQTTGLNLQTLRRLKFWIWFEEWTRPTELQVTLIWAGVIGFCGAACSIAYRVATTFVHKILTGSSAPGLVESFAELPVWGRLIIPAIGGLIAGAIMHFGSRFHGQITTTDYMEAVVLGDGKISARQSLVKSLSALFTIASGGSIGREGPLVQLAAMVASLAGRLQRWTTPRLRLLVGCGAAAESLPRTTLQFPAPCLLPRSCWVPWQWKSSDRWYLPQ
jgi:CIC family chloride channel protein